MKRIRATAVFVGLGLACFPTGLAYAASEDAWETFRTDVEAKCLTAAEALFETAVATVDPFGSESYGLALVRGKAKGADAEIAAICVYDKQAKTVEIGGELPATE